MIRIKKHILYLNCYELIVSNFGLLDRNLIFQKQIKNEYQAYTIIDDYLKRFEEIEKISENKKLNEIKFQYLIKNNITGLWNCIGFDFASYEINI
ncbi:hypothetical protein [Staphylococcus chromogenes]|uniref:hypothetical protein n=1 Tax=Staphylococcus chromogenes TaxID=46126 RepID=UPI002887CD04|nr:hypothetical protein [Staphylococcus chromogenes]MDT0700403.1 hypothetical protein [Staphylococcus chromogenes]